MDPRPGDVVTSNVRLVRMLGKGGMGSVWIARHASLDVDVAVKFVSRELLTGGDPLVVERFKREAKLAAKIESPHVVRVFDQGVTAEGTPYIVMELLRGESLFDRVARVGRIAPRDAARIVTEVAVGLGAAHAIGVIHRDIKPHNVFLARSSDGLEISKILDFGIAKTTTGEEVHKAVKTSTGVLIGTPQYMSPEQLMHAGPADASVDLWALSVVAYEMITGKLPFSGATLAATLVAITRAEIRPPSSTIPEVSGELDAFFLRALSADADKRYETASALAAAFAEAAGGIAPAPIVPVSSAKLEVEEEALPSDLSTAEFLASTGGGSQAPTRREAVEDAPSSEPVRATAATRLDMSRSARETASVGAASGGADPEAVPTKQSAKSDSAEKAPREGLVAVPSSGSKTPWIVALGAVAVTAIVTVVMFARREPPAPPASSASNAAVPTAPLPSASASPTAPAPAPSASAPPPPRVPAAFKRQVVPEGKLEGKKQWVPDLWVERDPADNGKGFLAAELACRSRKLALCSEAQFERACATHAVLAEDPTWTFTSESGGFVIRGGAQGCATRAVVEPADVDPARGALCCTRGVSLTGDFDRFGSPRNASVQIAKFEGRFNAGDGAGIAKESVGSLGFFNQTLAPDKIQDTIFWVSKKMEIVEDTCAVALVPHDPDAAWAASCNGIELELDMKSDPGKPQPSIAVKQAFRKLEFVGSGLLRDVRTWQHPRGLIFPP
ncbi:MAG: serine/threonine-protein kinase [Polyangiaceae bacterium]